MKELWKNEKKNLILVFAYTVIALIVYCVWFESWWHRWYITLLTGLGVVIIGAVVGYFFIKSDIKAKNQKEQKVEEKPEEVKEETEQKVEEQ
jgi:phosphotransferase system  glucose/maltose/N-acetylglucosamine-specific IIC component